MNMNDKAANDEANADASRTSNSQHLDLDGDGDEEFTNFLSHRPRSPNQDDAHAHARGDGTPDPPASPLPLPTREMETTNGDDAPMPASRVAAAFEETEEGFKTESPAAAAARLGSTGLGLAPPPVRPASAREGLEPLEDEEDEGPESAARFPQNAPIPDTALLVELEEVDQMPPVPAAQTAAAYEEMEHAMRNLPSPLPVMPPMPAALMGSIFEDEEEGETENKMLQTNKKDDSTPAEDPQKRERVRHQQERILQQARGPLTPAKTSLKRKRKRVRRQQERILQKAHGSHTSSAEDAQHPSTNPPVHVPAITTQPGAGATPLGRTQSVIVLPIRPTPRSMLPPSDDDDDMTNTPSVPRLHEVEATLYEQDSVVYLGTPVEDDLRPWWKKKRIPIAIAVSGLIAGSAVALWATLGFSREPAIASSQPSETQYSLPSLEPSQSSPPSEIPSLLPTFHPSQSVAPISVRSAPPSTSLVPSTPPSSSPSTPPSASIHPTAFCFEGAVNIFTNSHPEDTSWTLSRITAEGVANATVVREGSPEYESSPHTYEICLERGEYEFTIYDTFGDGICCDEGAGHFELVLDGWVVLEGGEFGFSQTVSFSLPAASLPPSRSSVPSRSLSPTLWPSASLGPSSQVPSLVPTFSLQPSSLPSLLPTAPPSTYWSSLIWKQKGQTITGEAPGDESGFSVVLSGDLSGDGMTMAIGSPGLRKDRPGYVKVYCKEDNASSWQDLGQKIEGTANGDSFGETLAFSEDGRTLAIGAPGPLDRPGYVRVYQLEGDDPGSSWKQLGQDITRKAGVDMFGWSVALSANGRTLAIGDPTACDSAGFVRIYGWNEDGPNWKQLGQDLEGEASSDQSGYSNQSGYSLDLSSNGMTVAIGAPGNDGSGEDSGHVRVYRRKGDGQSWEQLGQDIGGESPGDSSGFSISLSTDGRVLAIGGRNNDGNGDDAGHVRVYYINEAGPSWEQLGQDIDGEAAGDRSGRSLSLSADGKTVAIGANTNDGNGNKSGHVRVYRMEDGPNWIQVGRDIDGETHGDNAGWAVSLSADGRTVAIGSNGVGQPTVGSNWGHVRVFNVNY